MSLGMSRLQNSVHRFGPYLGDCGGICVEEQLHVAERYEDVSLTGQLYEDESTVFDLLSSWLDRFVCRAGYGNRHLCCNVFEQELCVDRAIHLIKNRTVPFCN